MTARRSARPAGVLASGAAPGGPAVSFAGVTRSFGRSRAVDEVSLSAGPGIVALLGPNGAGKSTLLRIAATVLAPDRGEVRLLGLDPQALRTRAATSCPSGRDPARTSGSRSGAGSATSRRRLGSTPASRRSTWSTTSRC